MPACGAFSSSIMIKCTIAHEGHSCLVIQYTRLYNIPKNSDATAHNQIEHSLHFTILLNRKNKIQLKDEAHIIARRLMPRPSAPPAWPAPRAHRRARAAAAPSISPARQTLFLVGVLSARRSLKGDAAPFWRRTCSMSTLALPRHRSSHRTSCRQKP